MNKFLAFCIIFLAIACSETYSPKPKGYPRMDFPEKKYTSFESDCPFTFEHGTYSLILRADKEHPCWINIDYPFLKSRIHLSYKEIDGNLSEYIEDARTLVYRHTIRASAINENEIADKEGRVFARIYELEGNAASSIQFYAMDSTKHFLRGALYFNAHTNVDSLRPAIDFIREDVYHLLETLEWKE